MKNADAVYSLILLLAALAITSRVFRRQLRRVCGWAQRERTATICRRRIFWISLGYSLAEVGAIYLALLGLFAAEWMAGEMGGWSFFIAAALLTGGMGALAFTMWRIVPQPAYEFFARHGIDFDALLAGARMERKADGTWLYMDEDWYVAVRAGVACALYAPLIDFARPFHIELRSAGITCRSTRSYYLVEYAAKDGTRLCVRYAEAGGALKKWFRRFGGSLDSLA